MLKSYQDEYIHPAKNNDTQTLYSNVRDSMILYVGLDINSCSKLYYNIIMSEYQTNHGYADEYKLQLLVCTDNNYNIISVI